MGMNNSYQRKNKSGTIRELEMWENVNEVTDLASSFGSKNTKMMRERKLGLGTLQVERYGE